MATGDVEGVLTRRRLFLFVSLSVLAIVGSAYLVGDLATRNDDGAFDWELAALFGTAVGTTGLAIATGALAYATSGDVKATWQLADLTRRDQVARNRPLLVVTGWQSLFPDDGDSLEGTLPVTLRNIGLGPVNRVVIEARFAPDPDSAEIYPSIARGIMPGEEVQMRLAARFPKGIPPGARYGHFDWRGSYFDRSENEYELEFGVAQHGRSDAQTGLRWSKAGTPFIQAREAEEA